MKIIDIALLAIAFTFNAWGQTRCHSAPASPANTTTVSSIATLKSALADNQWDTIIVSNGRYYVAAAGTQGATSLWIGSAYASRTRPVYVRAATRGSVIFDGSGGSTNDATWADGGISFEEGAHHQVWDGFKFKKFYPGSTGVMVIGGYNAAPAHDITMKYCDFDSTRGRGGANDHFTYFSQSMGTHGDYNFTFDHVTYTDNDLTHGGMSSAFHFYHSDAPNGLYNAHDVTISYCSITGTQQGMILWDNTLYNIYTNNLTVTSAVSCAVRLNYTTAVTGVTFTNCTSTASGGVSNTGSGSYTSTNCTWN